ncbi:MAG: type II toxin-antitoxin system HicB family antitoxin [Azoarcus sp.]|jgi:antitoxin HicB|nr:type II toxin-antitoxin system HicB family antitoxin [Azoarcus sp.]
MNSIGYQAILSPQPEGGFTVTFPDIPEAITEGNSREEAIFNATEVLGLCLDVRMERNDPLPHPTETAGGEWITPYASVQVAIALKQIRESQGKTLSDVARQLNTSWPAAQRLERPNANPTLRQLDRAAAAMGKRLILLFE